MDGPELSGGSSTGGANCWSERRAGVQGQGWRQVRPFRARRRSLKSSCGTNVASALPIRIESGGGQKSSCAKFTKATLELPPEKKREPSPLASDMRAATGLSGCLRAG